MTTVNVVMVGTWISDAVDPTQSVQAFKVDRKKQDTKGGQFRDYAGGRTRIITTASDTSTSAVTFRSVSEADKNTLLDFRGRVLLLRDPLGWRRFGSYLSADTVQTGKGLSLYDVSFMFTEVTFDESV